MLTLIPRSVHKQMIIVYLTTWGFNNFTLFLIILLIMIKCLLNQPGMAALVRFPLEMTVGILPENLQAN